MKAKNVNESLEFKEDMDPYNAIGVGKYDDNYDITEAMDGDKIELLEDIYYVHNLSLRKALMTKELLLEYLVDVEYKKGTIFVCKDDYDWHTDNRRIHYKWVDEHSELFKKLRN